MLETILPVAGVSTGGIGVFFAVLKFASKLKFYYKTAKQAVAVFEEVKEANSEIYERVKSDPNRKELAAVLGGAVKKIQGLTGI